MTDIDPITGLPTEIGSFEELAKETQKITISTAKKKFGKIHTMIEGLDEKEIDLKEISKKFKSRFATGGTIKNGIIDLHGDHRKRVTDMLVEMGFPADTIHES